MRGEAAGGFALFEAELTLLGAPVEGQVDTPDQLRCIEIRWLSPLRDRLDDVGRQESQGQNTADIAIVDSFAGGQLGDRCITGAQCVEAAMRPNDFLEEGSDPLSRAQDDRSR